MVFNKKGQGLSLNVIIVAILALIVLVVLVMVFTGRIGLFQIGLGGDETVKLNEMRVGYGQCAPNSVAENTFKTEYSNAESDTDKLAATSNFENEISICKGLSSDKTLCESGTKCRWK